MILDRYGDTTIVERDPGFLGFGGETTGKELSILLKRTAFSPLLLMVIWFYKLVVETDRFGDTTVIEEDNR